jgi:hypothetical protein
MNTKCLWLKTQFIPFDIWVICSFEGQSAFLKKKKKTL